MTSDAKFEQVGLAIVLIALAFVAGIWLGASVSSTSNPAAANAATVAVVATPVTTTHAPSTSSVESTSALTTTIPLDPPTILVVGDSNGLLLAEGMKVWAEQTGLAVVENRSVAGCGIGRYGERKDWNYRAGAVPDFCNNWEERWADHLEVIKPDIVLVVSAAWEVTTRRLRGDTQWRAVGDVVYDDFLRAEFTEALDLLGSQGAVIVWPNYMYLEVGREQGVAPLVPYLASDHDRMDKVNAIIREFVDARDNVEAYDLAALLDETFAYGQLDPVMRPDGVHFTEEAAIAAGANMGIATLEAAADLLAAN